MASFEPDCRIAEQQIIWLQSLRPTDGEKLAANFHNKFLGFPSLDKTYFDRKQVANGNMDWWIQTNIRQVYKECQK